MTNFETLTTTLMRLLLDVNIGLSLPLRRMVALLTASLLEGTTLQLTALAEAFPDIETGQAVKEHRIRRFLSNPSLAPQMFLPVFLHLLRPVFARMPEITLALDRTSWKKRQRHVKILMVAVTFQGRALPLMWTVSNHAGNTALAAWKTVLTPVITALQGSLREHQPPVVVVADREFASPRLAEWLKTTYRVESVLRLKRSEYLGLPERALPLAEFLPQVSRGTLQSYHQISVTKASTFLLNVTITWGQRYAEPLILATTLEDAAHWLRRYERRFWIEPSFKDQKSNGFDLEHTKVTAAKRIETLLIIGVFAHLFCSTEGYRQETQGTLKKNARHHADSSARIVSRRAESLSTATSTRNTLAV